MPQPRPADDLTLQRGRSPRAARRSERAGSGRYPNPWAIRRADRRAERRGGGVLGVVTALPNGRQATACAVVALGGILVAGLGGLAFLMGGQSNGASYLMAVGFLVAVGGYLAEVVTVR